jgi:hypothetical protein
LYGGVETKLKIKNLNLKFLRSRSQAAVIQQVPGSGRGIATGLASATTVSLTLAMCKAIGFGKMI